MPSSPTFDRSDARSRLATEAFDVLVVGGGITGAGIALEASSRGLRTALVERDDFASGTSSRSSKMVHGGLRYLQNGDLRLVYQALRERRRLTRNAPHLVHIETVLLPLYRRGGLVDHRLARMMGAAMWAYDLTGGWRIGRLHDHLSADEAVARVPSLPRDRISGAYVYYDGRADDARLTLAVLRTAALGHGAAVANRVAVTGLVKDGAGRVVGATAHADGDDFDIRAAVVVNAAGVWSDEVLALDQPDRERRIRPAKGIHVAVPRSRVGTDVCLGLPAGRHGSIFVAPWGDRAYIGTTDTAYDGALDDPQCTPEDVAFLIDAVNAGLDGVHLTTDDVVGTWAGLRPLVAGGSGRTRDMSRRHDLRVSPSGLVSIAGGKLTTYREMAAETVDEAGRVLGRHLPRSRTARLPLRGAEGYEATRTRRGTDPERAVHLAERYGGEAELVHALIDARPELAEPLVAGLPYLRAEAVHAVRHEMATTLDDVLSRRTRARLLARDATDAAAAAVAGLLAAELGWSTERCAEEVASLRGSLADERASYRSSTAPAGPTAP